MNVSHDLAGLVSRIYGAAYAPTEWFEALETIRVALNASHVCLVRQGPNMTDRDRVQTHPDPHFARMYLEDDRFRNDRMWAAFMQRPSGPPAALEELCGADHLYGSPLFQEWLLPQDIVRSSIMKVMVAGSSHWLFDIARGRRQPEFDADDVAVIAALAPHLRRASEIGRMMALNTMTGPWHAGAAIGIASVDAELRIVAMNAAAEAILARPGCPLMRGGGRLRLCGASGDRMARLIKSTCAADTMTSLPGGEMLASGMAHEDGTRVDLALSIGPAPRGFLVEPLATVLMREMTPLLPARFATTAMAIFGLTAKESRLATLLAEGRTLTQAATFQGISITTARTHLAHIFRKTETRQQSELVARLRLIEGIARRL